jgi:hypothetical protein
MRPSLIELGRILHSSLNPSASGISPLCEKASPSKGETGGLLLIAQILFLEERFFRQMRNALYQGGLSVAVSGRRSRQTHPQA